jgi:hypothetical protein
MGVDHALFGVDEGIGGIRREPGDGELFDLDIVLHAMTARFLVAAEEDADPSFEGPSGVDDGLEGKKSRHDGTLVVEDAPAVDAVPFEDGGKGLPRPALTGGNDVEVTQDGDHLLPLAGFGIAGHAIDVDGPETEAPRQVEGMVKSLPDRAAEGSALPGLFLDAGDGDAAADFRKERLLVPLKLRDDHD